MKMILVLEPFKFQSKSISKLGNYHFVTILIDIN